MSLKDKLTSRKFWLCVAALLASIGSTIAGFSSNNGALALAGIICATVSSGIYSVCEALIDAEAVSKED